MCGNERNAGFFEEKRLPKVPIRIALVVTAVLSVVVFMAVQPDHTKRRFVDAVESSDFECANAFLDSSAEPLRTKDYINVRESSPGLLDYIMLSRSITIESAKQRGSSGVGIWETVEYRASVGYVVEVSSKGQEIMFPK